MTPISFQAFTDAGCMVIYDPSAGFDFTDEWLGCLNHVTDPDGRTCATSDYPPGEWPAVWQRNVRRLRELSRNGEFTLLLCDEVDHACRISDELSISEAQRLRSRFEEWIHAPSGRLIICDAMAAFSGDTAMEMDPLAEFTVSPGWNKVSIHGLAEPSVYEHIEGYEGSCDFPALVFTFSAFAAKPPADRAEDNFPRIQVNHTRSVGSLCEATVVGTNAIQAKLMLHTSRSITSGWARLRMTNADQIKVGDRLLVRLVEHKKAYWVVERS